MASTATFSRLVRRAVRCSLRGLALALAPLARCEEERKEEPFSKILDDAAAGASAAPKPPASRTFLDYTFGRNRPRAVEEETESPKERAAGFDI